MLFQSFFPLFPVAVKPIGKLKALKVLKLRHFALSDEDFKYVFVNKMNLVHLDISYKPRLPFQRLINILIELPALKILNVTGCSSVTDDFVLGWFHLPDSPNNDGIVINDDDDDVTRSRRDKFAPLELRCGGSEITIQTIRGCRDPDGRALPWSFF